LQCLLFIFEAFAIFFKRSRKFKTFLKTAIDKWNIGCRP
jgi:hypothetical protein